MRTEKHIVNKTYGNHQLARYIDVYEVTTSTDGHGTMTASPMSGFAGTNVMLSNTPNANYGFSGYSITGATLTGNQFTLNNDVTAKAWFSAVPYYTAMYFNNGSPFQGATAFTGSYLTADNNPTIDYFQPVSRVTKSYTVSRNLTAMSWDGTAVNLEFTGNIFAYPSPVKYNDFYGMKDKYTTYSEVSDGLRHNVTAGYMKLSATESAFITAVYIDVTGVTNNVNGNVNNLKIKLNDQTLNSTGYMINETGSIYTLNNGSPGKVVLSSPIVITGNNQKLTFYVTGTAPSTGHTVSNIRPNSAVWYGYISGLHS